MSRLSAIRAESSGSQITSWDKYSGQLALDRALARRNSVLTANAVSNALRDGRQMTELPHTSASKAFSTQTRNGKLNDVSTTTGPIGCQISDTTRLWLSVGTEKPDMRCCMSATMSQILIDRRTSFSAVA